MSLKGAVPKLFSQSFDGRIVWLGAGTVWHGKTQAFSLITHSEFLSSCRTRHATLVDLQESSSHPSFHRPTFQPFRLHRYSRFVLQHKEARLEESCWAEDEPGTWPGFSLSVDFAHPKYTIWTLWNFETFPVRNTFVGHVCPSNKCHHDLKPEVFLLNSCCQVSKICWDLKANSPEKNNGQLFHQDTRHIVCQGAL